jgi:hypothetical protein
MSQVLGFGPAYGPGNGTPAIQEFNHTVGADFDVGEVVINSAGEVVSSGADPAAGTIVGVALAGTNSAPGFSMANQPATVTWRTRNVPVALANGNVFRGKIVSGSAVVVAPVLADLNTAGFGITKHGRVWYVDRAKTGATARVVIVKIDTENNNVWFRFIESFTTQL